MLLKQFSRVFATKIPKNRIFSLLIPFNSLNFHSNFPQIPSKPVQISASKAQKPKFSPISGVKMAINAGIPSAS